MPKPIYPKEKTLFAVAFIIAALFWAVAVYATKGIILLLFPVFFLIYLFAQSAFISYMKGTGALVSDNQFPDIQERAKICAEKLGIRVVPKMYIMNGNGLFNAFATRFLRKDYIILLSDVLDALEDHPESINFYIGHEMGHIDRKHLLFEPFLSIALILPLLGAAYSRAREYTCDQYGAACCSPAAAQQGISLLAVGSKRYKTINLKEYMNQIRDTSGFWMSFHELIGSYPWLVKRFARISPDFRQDKIPNRNLLAYIPALFVPRFNVISLVIIYIVIVVALGMGGVLKERDLMINAGKRLESETGTADLSVAEVLDHTVASINKTVPQKIDEMTTLNKAHVEGANSLVYDFSIALNKSEIDFNTVKEAVFPDNLEHWCNNPDTEFFKNQGTKIIYRYVDLNGQGLGEITFDMSDPNTCPQ